MNLRKLVLTLLSLVAVILAIFVPVGALWVDSVLMDGWLATIVLSSSGMAALLYMYVSWRGARGHADMVPALAFAHALCIPLVVAAPLGRWMAMDQMVQLFWLCIGLQAAWLAVGVWLVGGGELRVAFSGVGRDMIRNPGSFLGAFLVHGALAWIPWFQHSIGVGYSTYLLRRAREEQPKATSVWTNRGPFLSSLLARWAVCLALFAALVVFLVPAVVLDEANRRTSIYLIVVLPGLVAIPLVLTPLQALRVALADGLPLGQAFRRSVSLCARAPLATLCLTTLTTGALLVSGPMVVFLQEAEFLQSGVDIVEMIRLVVIVLPVPVALLLSHVVGQSLVTRLYLNFSEREDSTSRLSVSGVVLLLAGAVYGGGWLLSGLAEDMASGAPAQWFAAAVIAVTLVVRAVRSGPARTLA